MPNLFPFMQPGLLDEDAQKGVQLQGLLGVASGLLDAAGPSPVRRSLGQGISAGLTTGLAAMNNATNQAYRGQQFGLQKQLLGQQIGAGEAAAAESARRSLAIEQLQRGASPQTIPYGVEPSSGGPLTTPGISYEDRAALMWDIDPAAAAQMTDNVSFMSQLDAGAFGNLDPNQIETMRAIGPANARKFLMNASDPGLVPSNVREWEYYNSLTPEKKRNFLNMKRAGKIVDTGPGFVSVNPVDPTAPPTLIVEKGLAPGDTPAHAAAVEGAKVEGRRAANAPYEKAGFAIKLRRAGVMLETVESAYEGAKALSSQWTTGMMGALSSFVPGTKGYNLAQKLKTLKSAAGLDRLIALKSEGGTLGALSEKELDLLIASFGNLEQAQGQEEFEQGMDDVVRRLRSFNQILQDEYEIKFAGIDLPGQGAATEITDKPDYAAKYGLD